MSSSPASKFNLLSVGPEQLKEKKQQIIHKAKIDLLEILDVNKNMVNRQSCAEAIGKNRDYNRTKNFGLGIPHGEIEIRKGVKMLLDIKKYPDIEKEYENIIKQKPDTIKQQLKVLDIRLAERLILDNGKHIEYKGTSAQSDSAESYDGLNQNEIYKDKIDLVMKQNGEEKYFIIKWTEAQLEKFRQEAEQAGIIHTESEEKVESADDRKTHLQKEYENLQGLIKQDEKLKRLYNNLYETILEDQLNIFFSGHKALKEIQSQLSQQKKMSFFMEVISSNKFPKWLKNYPSLEKVWKKNILDFNTYKEVFKEKILNEFTGETDVELKEFILERLGTERFTKEIDITKYTYAQGILADEVMTKYKSPVEEKALGYALNVFSLGLEDESIAPLSDDKLFPEHEDLRGEKDIDVAIADTEAVSEEKALQQANQEFAEKYQSSMKRGFSRARMFFFRSTIINKKVKEKMKGTNKKLITDAETSSAVNRWMLKKELDLAGADKIKEETTVFTDPEFQRDLNNLTNDFLQNPSADDKTYESAVAKLINNNLKLQKYMKSENITQIGTNLVERVQFEKRQRVYYQDIIKILHEYEIKGEIKTRAELDVKLRDETAKFSREQNKLPDLVKELKLDINSIQFAEQLAKHRNKLEIMRMRTVNMRVNMLVNATPKKEPKGIWNKFTSGTQKDERGLTTAQHVQIDKLGGRNKFYKWIEKHPYWTALGTAGALVGSATIGALTAPLLGTSLIGTGMGAGVLFVLNYFKKRGHYTKDHVKFEKELLAMTPDAREKYLQDMETKAEKKPERLRKIFPTRYDKYASSMEYLKSTQTAQKYIDDIARYVNKQSKLDSVEKTLLEDNVINGIAAMKLQEETGRNFTFSDEGKANIEQLYNKLYTTILGGIQRYAPTQNPVAVYKTIEGGVAAKATKISDDTEYAKDKAKMASMRNKLGVFAGTKAAGIYLGTAWLVGQISQGRHHMFGSTTTTTPGSTLNGMDLNSGLQSTIQGELGKTIDFSHLSSADKLSVINRLSSHGYGVDPVTNQIYHVVTTPGTAGLQLDSAFGPKGQDLLNQVFAGDTAKFQAFQAKMMALSPHDRTTTLRGTMKDLYGTNQLATQKTRAFFDHFGNSIMEKGHHELITLASQSPLSTHGADAIAGKMTSRYTHSGMLTGNEFKTVTDPTQIKALFDGFAKGTYTLNNLPAGWDVQTANDVLHCKYAGFGDGLKEYIFDLGNKGGSAKDIVGKLITGNIPGGTGTSTVGWDRGHFTKAGIPTVWNEVNNFKNTRR